jgi:RNA polymerase sigma-70 factor (ECF subfamily)
VRTCPIGRRTTTERETNLVLQAAAGDREAFGRLAETCRPWLFGLCLRVVRDSCAAEDLVQQALLLAWRDLAQLREPERFRAWLSRIAANVCRMHLRRRLARPAEMPLAEEAPAGTCEAPDAPLGVDQALVGLDLADRRMLTLFYGEGLSHAEVGEVLALSAAAVKSRLHRARERLRKEMLAMMTDEQKTRLDVTEKAPWKLRTILLVEPDSDVRESLRKALTAAGYEVLMLPTGEAALAAVRERRGQLLILDKHCGEPHWIEVLVLLQADAWSRENVPVAVLIDPGSERDVILAWQAGAQLCLTRPPLPDELVGFVKRLERLWPQELGSRSG